MEFREDIGQYVFEYRGTDFCLGRRTRRRYLQDTVKTLG